MSHYQMGLCVIHKSKEYPDEEKTNVYDIAGIRRISPGFFILKVKEETSLLPKEAGEEITDDFIEKQLAYHYLYENKSP